MQSPYTGLSGLSGSSCQVLRLDTAPTCYPEDPDCPDPPVEYRGWTQPLHAVRKIRTVRILLSSPEAGHSPYMLSGGSGLSGSSCRVPRVDTDTTCCPEDPDCPDPPVESQGWTQPLHAVRRIRTVRILPSSPEAGHSPYTASGESSCRVPRLDTATTCCPEDPDCPDPPVESRGWTQPLHSVRRILLSSPEAGHSHYMLSGGSGLSGSSCRVPRLDTAPTQRLEDPDCPDPPVEARGWTQPLHSVRRIRTFRILLSSPEAGHSHYMLSGGSGLSGSSSRVPRLDTATTCCPEDPDCPDPPVESRGWTQTLHAVRRIRTVRILLSSPKAGHSHYMLSGGSGLSGSSRRVPRLDTAPTQRPENPPVESRGWTQPLHAVRRIRTVRILLSSPEAGHSPYTASGESSCRVPRLDTATTCCPEDPDCPDPPVESRGWTQPLHSVWRIRTVRILLLRPEAGHSPYTASGGSGLSGSSCRVPRLDTATTCCPEDPDCPDPPLESRGWTQPLHAVHSHYMLSGGSGLSGSSCRVPRLDTAPTQRPEDPDCPDPPVESRGWTQPLHSVRRIRTVRILLLSPEAGHSPYTASGGSSCRVSRLDTATTCCPEDPDCPDPPVGSRGWTQPLHSVRMIRTVRILLEAGHSPYMLSGSSCRVPRLDKVLHSIRRFRTVRILL